MRVFAVSCTLVKVQNKRGAIMRHVQKNTRQVVVAYFCQTSHLSLIPSLPSSLKSNKNKKRKMNALHLHSPC